MSGNALLEDSNDGGGVGRYTQSYLAALEATKNIPEAEKDNKVCRDKTLNNSFNYGKTEKKHGWLKSRLSLCACVSYFAWIKGN